MKTLALNHGAVTLVDDEDYELLSQYTWRVWRRKDGACYVRRPVWISGVGPRAVLMHRQVMQAEHGWVVDHINFDGLDNRKVNLRLCKQKENTEHRRPWGESAFKGVSRHRNKWRAAIKKDGVQYALGSFDNEVDAAEAYDTAAKHLHGPFAVLNFS